MGSNKFILKKNFSSGVFPAKSGPSSFALTPLCCSGVAKNCKSSFLVHGIFVTVVFRLRECVPGKKMVSAIAGDDWSLALCAPVRVMFLLLLGLPRVWVLSSLASPQGALAELLCSPGSVTALLLQLPGARAGCCVPVPKYFLFVSTAVSSAVVPLIC